MRDFDPANDRMGSRPVLRRCRLSVRFARKRTGWQFMSSPLGSNAARCRSPNENPARKGLRAGSREPTSRFGRRARGRRAKNVSAAPEVP
jgi:hypothetical protein